MPISTICGVAAVVWFALSARVVEATDSNARVSNTNRINAVMSVPWDDQIDDIKSNCNLASIERRPARCPDRPAPETI